MAGASFRAPINSGCFRPMRGAASTSGASSFGSRCMTGEDPVRFPFSLLSSSLMDVTAEFFLENIEHVFLKPALPNGTLVVHGIRVNLDAITRTALMTVEAENDDIAAPGQTRIAQARVCCTDRVVGVQGWLA